MMKKKLYETIKFSERTVKFAGKQSRAGIGLIQLAV
nr:MAG TPA: hypothetical protein [Siphoviridae sp. cta6m1]